MITEIAAPHWAMLQKLVEGCEAKLLICSRWISTRGIEQLEGFVVENTHIRSMEIWTRITEVATDSRSLLQLARSLKSRGVQVVIKDSQFLHLKVYLADETAALLGSANLTESGFSINAEIVVSTSDPVLLQQIIGVMELIQMDTVTCEELAEFVSTQLPDLEAHAAA